MSGEKHSGLTRNQREALARYDRARLRLQRPATRRNRLRVLRAFLAALGKPVRRIERGDVEAYLALWAELAPASQKQALSAVRGLCRFLAGEGVLERDPTQGLTVRVPRRETESS